MGYRNIEQTTFADAMITPFKKKTFYDRIDEIIDWRPVDELLRKNDKRISNKLGNSPYPPLPLLKVLMCASWNNLSDRATEEALYFDLRIIRFCGFSLSSNKPDHSTICRFRNTLVELNLFEKILEKINNQLEEQGVIIKAGAIVDATVVESSRHPNKTIEILPEDRKEEEQDSDCRIVYSDDIDARWLRKGKKAYYGYKAVVATDATNGFFLSANVVSANSSDVKQLIPLLEKTPLDGGTPVYTDKGFDSKENRSFLKSTNLADGIMHKAARNRPLTEKQKRWNKIVSSYRYKVEQCFGTWKRLYGFQKTKYLGTPKVLLETYLNGMAFNLKKAAHLSL